MEGATLSHYRVVGKLGAGGMGTVYRAHDTKLGREVAIKVLPEELSRDRERLERFGREARLLARLNHPNIATIHGLEEDESTPFLVLELVEGETLAERIARGPLGLDEAISLFLQVAEALEAAHEKGIIHRDLKPENVKITPEGKVKILDFGLARLGEAETEAFPESSMSPTLTKGTALGAILGTPSYMSPEQARGKLVDKRTDIWAFGCCLYEALSGKRAFDGETVTDRVAAVLSQEPDWESLPDRIPGPVARLLRRCLEKDRRRRIADIADARLEIEDALRKGPNGASDAPGSAVTGGTLEPRPSHRREAAAWMLALLASSAIVAFAVWSRNSTEPPVTTRLSIQLPPGQKVFDDPSNPLALSPDGRLLVFSALPATGTIPRLYLRRLDRFESETIPGGENGSSPFFSPDGETIGFLVRPQEDALKKLSLKSGAVSPIASPRKFGADPRGFSWGDDGSIVFGTVASGLFTVAASGGEPEPLTSVDTDESHRHPHHLPDGRHLLFSITPPVTSPTNPRAFVAVLSLETREWRVLFEGAMPRYLPSGHIVYTQGASLLAVPFDLDTVSVRGPATTLLNDVFVSGASGAIYPAFSVSKSGVLVYAGGVSDEKSMIWVDRSGQETRLASVETSYHTLRLSQDGRFVAAHSGSNNNIWAHDLFRSTRTLVVRGPDLRGPALWDAGEGAILFGMDRGVYRKASDGTGEPTLLLSRRGQPLSMSRDARFLLFAEVDPETGRDIWIQDEGGNVERLFATEANENAAVFSPDGRWIAYQTDASGRPEIYVEPFPGPGPRTQVSTEGGTGPVWSPRGDEIFYRQRSALMTVPVKTDGRFEAGKPALLFDGPYQFDSAGHASYDVSSDGRRFLMLRLDVPPVADVGVVLNFAEELKRLAPLE